LEPFASRSQSSGKALGKAVASAIETDTEALPGVIETSAKPLASNVCGSAESLACIAGSGAEAVAGAFDASAEAFAGAVDNRLQLGLGDECGCICARAEPDQARPANALLVAGFILVVVWRLGDWRWRSAR
tara:strand:+ start:3688 stop:4080 length:393 start_codon:yes stop_codon:yes gene_type:complete